MARQAVPGDEMMRYAVYPETRPASIPVEANALQLVRPVSIKKLAKILKRSNVEEVWLSNSCRKRLGVKTRKLLKESGVVLRDSDERGRAIEVDAKKLREIAELHRDDQSYREIERLTGIPKSTAHYLVRYADRAKVKRGRQTVYLK